MRLGKDNDSVNACTPGFCKTDMTSSSSSIGSTAAAEGADKPVHLGLLPPGSPTGEFWRDKTVIESCLYKLVMYRQLLFYNY